MIKMEILEDLPAVLSVGIICFVNGEWSLLVLLQLW